MILTFLARAGRSCVPGSAAGYHADRTLSLKHLLLAKVLADSNELY
jgi:hypothetical protein